MTRRTRLWILLAVVGLAILAVVLAIVLSGGDDDGNGSAGPAATDGTVETSMFDGIPQKGEILGEPDAPLVVLEFADPQCPFCAQFANEVLPTVVQDYVRPGRIRMRLKLLSFLGDDSIRGARAAYAASLQNKMWEFMEGFYVNQGPENTGYATDDFLRDIAEDIDGLDAEKLFADRDSDQVTALLSGADAAATRLGVQGTPSFYAGRTERSAEQLQADLSVESFTAALDAVVNQAG